MKIFLDMFLLWKFFYRTCLVQTINQSIATLENATLHHVNVRHLSWKKSVINTDQISCKRWALYMKANNLQPLINIWMGIARHGTAFACQSEVFRMSLVLSFCFVIYNSFEFIPTQGSYNFSVYVLRLQPFLWAMYMATIILFINI